MRRSARPPRGSLRARDRRRARVRRRWRRAERARGHVRPLGRAGRRAEGVRGNARPGRDMLHVVDISIRAERLVQRGPAVVPGYGRHRWGLAGRLHIWLRDDGVGELEEGEAG